MNYLEYTTEEEAVELIDQELSEMDDNTLVAIHNEFCDLANYPDDKIFENDEEFFEVNFSDTMDAIRAALHGDYNYNHKWVQFNGYANLDSTDDPSAEIDRATLSQYIFDNENQFYSLPFELEEVEPEEEEEV